MIEQIDGNDELTQLAAEISELQEKRRELRRDKEKTQENEALIDKLKTRLIYLLTFALIQDPQDAREIVEQADNSFTDKPRYGEGEYRTTVFGLLLKKRLKEGLYLPQLDEKPVHADYINALKFIERRMAMIEKLVKKGFKKYEPYLAYLRDARSKLKVRETTFWISTDYEESSIRTYGGNDHPDKFWNDLLVYTAQKSAGEIGGIDKIDGENRIMDRSPENPDKTYINIRSGHQIVDEVVAEAFKYDLYTASFLAVLERDLEIGTGQVLHFQRMGQWSRRRYTDAMCREAQAMYRPTIERHNAEVAEKIREIIDTKGEKMIPEADEQFAERLEAIMELFPQFKFQDIASKLPKEAQIEDENYKLTGINDFDRVPEYKDSEYEECYLGGDSSDFTAFEDSRMQWDKTEN